MSRGVKDLRDLICVSRLTIRESDDEILSDEDVNRAFDSLSLSSGNSSDHQGPSKPQGADGCVSPDSGFITNGSPSEVTSAGSKSATVTPQTTSKSKAAKRKRKKKALETLPFRHELPKAEPLPPVQGEMGSIEIVSDDLKYASSKQVLPKKGNFDNMLCFMDAAIVSGWLCRANEAVMELSKFCRKGECFVNFAHFWLCSFSMVQKTELFQMEYEIIIEEMNLAFSVGREQRKVMGSDITRLTSALFNEYPTKLLSSKGDFLFLDYLDILSSEKQEEYKQLLSNVRCSTRNKQYAQWLLATRSFTLVSVWNAIVNFYRNLTGQQVVSAMPLPSSVSKLDVTHQRLYQAIRLGYVDVLHYLIVAGHIDPHYVDSHRRSLVFTAVMHNQEEILNYLLTRVHPSLDVNLAADTGNTPLHAAANNGNLNLVRELLKSPVVDVNVINKQCEGATPLHLAVMHGHKKVVEALLSGRADCSMTMGDLTPEDIARDFGRKEIFQMLQNR